MTKFIDINLSTESAPAVCVRCAADQGLLHIETGIKFCYCRHRRIGVSLAPGYEWIVIRSLSRDEYLNCVDFAIYCASQIEGEPNSGGNIEVHRSGELAR